MALVQAVAVVVSTLDRRDPTVLPKVPQARSGTRSVKLPGTAWCSGLVGCGGSAFALVDASDGIAAAGADGGRHGHGEVERRPG